METKPLVAGLVTLTVAVPSHPFQVVLVDVRQLPSENLIEVVVDGGVTARVSSDEAELELRAAALDEGAVGLWLHVVPRAATATTRTRRRGACIFIVRLRDLVGSSIAALPGWLQYQET
jgi:hypothetical protein